MTDPLDDLKKAFSKATPAPDAQKKADTLARSQEIFEKMHGAAQGSANDARPTSDRPTKWAGFVTGVARMFSTVTSRPALTASTAIVAVGLVAILLVLREGPPNLPDLTRSEVEAPVAVNPESSQTRMNVESGSSDEEITPLAAFDEALLSDKPFELGSVVEPTPVAPLAKIAPSAEGRVRRQAEGSITGNTSSLSAGGVELSGAAEMGIMGSVDANTPFHNDVDVTFSLSGESDQGLTFGATIDLEEIGPIDEPNTEAFANEAPNPVKITAEEPVSTLSIDVDTASYSVVRSSLMNGYLPDAQSVRIEEMVNYFPYAYPAPDASEGPFKPTVTVAQTPWNADTKLMHIALQGQMPALEDRPPLNLVFLIDTSGSMNQPDKLPLLKQSFRLMLGQLRPQDEVSIVAYAGSAGRVLEPTAASERATILAALDRLDAGGSTAGQMGLQLLPMPRQALWRKTTKFRG